jgi:hypothetical protein
MTKQGITFNILDGQLGQQPPGQGQAEVVIGWASGGTVANFVPYTTTSPSVIQANSGNGSMSRIAAFCAVNSGNPVTCVSIPSAGAGTVTAVFTGSTTVTNTSSSVVTITGTPNDDYYLYITPQQATTAANVVGTAGPVVGLSLDGGKTFAYTVNLGTATTITTGSAFTTYTGLTISFAAGTLVTNDIFYAVATAPTIAAASVQSALAAVVKIKSEEFEDVYVAGVSSGAMAASYDTYMLALATTNKRFSRLLCSARDAAWGGASTETETAWITSIEADFTNNGTTRVGVAAGYYPFLDPYTSSIMRSSLLYGAGARNSAVLPSIDLGEVDLGGLPGCILPGSPDPFGKSTYFYHDEDVTPGLDAARFMAAWLPIGTVGLYVLNPNLMAPPGSDFNWLQHGHVIDEGCAAVYAFFLQKLSKPVRVSAKTGFILPQDRQQLQDGCNSQLTNALVGQVSGIVVQVSATDNILATSTITVNVYVIPLAYIKGVVVNMALFNPANQVASLTLGASGVPT